MDFIASASCDVRVDIVHLNFRKKTFISQLLFRSHKIILGIWRSYVGKRDDRRVLAA